MRILIVEDDDLSLDIATRWLRRQGYANVEGAVDGATGLESCLHDLPDILILDHSLPIVSGLAIAEHLCLTYKREDRPWIVLFTAAADSTIGAVSTFEIGRPLGWIMRHRPPWPWKIIGMGQE